MFTGLRKVWLGPFSCFHFVIFTFPSSAVHAATLRTSSHTGGMRAGGYLRSRLPATRSAGEQAGRASDLCSQHPYPLPFKLLEPAHHSAASLPQLLLILLENVTLWLRAGCYGDELSTHPAGPSLPSLCQMCRVAAVCACKALGRVLSVLSVPASPCMSSAVVGKQPCGCPPCALRTPARCSSSLETTSLLSCWVGSCITLQVGKPETLHFDSKHRGTVWSVFSSSLFCPSAWQIST